MTKKPLIEVIEFTDPVCTWCWGNEPLLRKLETRYEGDLVVNFIMGGLVKDIRAFRDDSNDIGGESDLSSVNASIANHWLEASEVHGMPVKKDGFKLFSEENPSTYPANIAYKAAQFQSEEHAKKFLRRMREAVASEARIVNQMEVLIELAQESRLDIATFIKSFSDGSAEKAFVEDLKLTREYRVNGFPSFLVRTSEGKEIMLRGYQSYNNFREIINHISNGKCVEKNLERTEKTILDFIRKYEHVAPIEVEMTFDLSKSEAEEMLNSLSKQKLTTRIPAGNGYFITPSFDPLSCDPVTGMCKI